MIVNICCLIIFITYFAICALLSYYFIKKRSIWNSIFSLDAIWISLRELVVCPEHFLIWLPFIDFENNECSEKKKINDDARIHIKKIIEHIAHILKNIINIKQNDKQNDKHNNNHNNNNNLEKMKWILEGTMKDFDRMYEENAIFYNNLSNSYDILNDKCKNNKEKSNEKGNEIVNEKVSLEDLVIIDNNIELCENISNILAIFSNADYKLLNQMDSGYMKSLIYDLIESIRIYKIDCLMQD
jgi:hypothetical protein